MFKSTGLVKNVLNVFEVSYGRKAAFDPKYSKIQWKYGEIFCLIYFN